MPFPSVPTSGLTKMTVKVESVIGDQPTTPQNVLFNPNEIKITHSFADPDSNQDWPGKANPKTLEVEFFFDTTLKSLSVSQQYLRFNQVVPNSKTSQDFFTPDSVVAPMQWLQDLTKLDGGPHKNRPRHCTLQWGKDIQFEGFLKSLNVTYYHFWSDGRPIRAKAACTFEEYKSDDIKQKERNPIDDPTRIVKRGETLSSIAEREFNDPTLWRIIAEANGITHPRRIHPGQVLIVPPRPERFS